MAEENEESQNQAEPEVVTAVPPKKKMLLLLIPILLVVGIVVALYFSGFADSFFQMNQSEETEKTENEVVEEKQPEATEAIFFEVPELLVNLSVKPDQKPIYFKIRIHLEMASAADVEQAEKMLPRIVDSLQFYLREMRLEEIQGSIGTYRLKEEIHNRLNRILAPVKINDVLFKEILIQ